VIDIPKLTALLACATDIKTIRIPEVRAKHGTGEQVETAVADMLIACADCLDRAVKILAEDGEYAGTVEYISTLIRCVLSEIEDCHAEAEGWRIATAMVEATKAVKH